MRIKPTRQQWHVILVLGIFALIYASISLVNHWNFRTSGFDLGIFNHALNDYAHFRWNTPTLLTMANRDIANILGDHFSLYVLFFSPFRWIFGSYTLLIFQIAAVLFGGYGIYRLIYWYNNSHRFALAAMLHFFLLWGIYSALSFDYHNNVVGAMLVPWFLLYAMRQQWRYALIFFGLILVGKENMAVWLVFINLGLLIHFFHKRRPMLITSSMAVFSAVYFVLLIKWLMPAIAGGAEYHHWNYSALGNNFSEAVMHIIRNPQHVFALLFEDPKLQQVAFGIKSELHFVVLLSGGFALLFRPQFLVMLLPIYAQKMFHNSFIKWGINYHYSIELLPVITIALFIWLASLKQEKWQLRAALAVILLAGFTTGSKLHHRVSKWYKPQHAKFFVYRHYVPGYEVGPIHSLLEDVPADASVSAQSVLVPHLAFRDTIYQYPVVGNANFIALIPGASTTYPLNQKQYDQKLNALKENPQWQMWKSSQDAMLFKRQKAIKADNSGN